MTCHPQQQAMRWLNAGVFEAIVDDLRVILRLVAGRTAQPGAVVIDSRTLQSTPESGAAAGYDGVKKRKGRKLHLLAAHVTAANQQEACGDVPFALRSLNGLNKSNGGRADRSKSPLWTQGTPVNKPPKMLPLRAFGSQWSGYPTPNPVLYCCPNVG